MEYNPENARLALAGVSLDINGRRVLDHIDLSLEAGEIHGLMNRMHDEKSMLCKAITGELPVSGGEIRFDGKNITLLPPRKIQALGIEYAGSRPMLQTGMTVADNLALGGRWSAGGVFTRKSLNAEIQDWLDRENFDLDASKRIADIPHSDHAFIEILNRLRRSPRLLIVDESLDRLMAKRQRELLAAFRRHAARDGMATLWTSNEIENLLLRADRISVMRENRIILTDRVQNLNQFSVIRLCFDQLSDAEQVRQRAMVSENLKNIGLLAAGVAHEVNNPLEIMTNLVSYLRLTATDDKTRELLQKVEAEAERIQKIVDNLVLFSGRRNKPAGTVDIRLLIGEILDLIGFHVRGMRIEFHFDGGDIPLPIDADHNEIRQVFLNLIRNSIEALKRERAEEGGGGHIRIAALAVKEFDQTKIRVTLEDDGPGIRMEHVEDIFLPFVSDKIGDSPNQGLGLSIVYNLVREHGGVISVKNLPDKGCRFTLEFPAALPPE